MGFFERYLSVWVALCIVVGVVLGKVLGADILVLSSMNIATVNIPVAILVWFMIFPMMVQVDFSLLKYLKNILPGLFYWEQPLVRPWSLSGLI